MFGRSYKVGTLLGFQIEISITFLIIMAFFALSGATSAGVVGAVAGVLMGGLLFGSVLMHELGHAVVARRLGIRILGIELHIVGGAAKMASPPRSARDEVIVAVAGPAVSFILGVLFGVLWLVSGSPILGNLALINGMLGVFNLLPALPMDGGRVLRALLSERLGRLRATHVAAAVAQGLAATMVVLGIAQSIQPFLYISGTPLQGFALILVGFLVWMMAAQERAMASRWRYADEAPAAQVLDANGRIISGDPGMSGNVHAPHPGYVHHGVPDHHAARGQGEPGVVRRVYRLPNGQVMVVEEHVRW